MLLAAPLGLLTGWPAISRHGLSLALATFAVGVAVSRFVFAQPYATSGLSLARPSGFDGDRAYYVLELALLATALLATHALRRGRTGRALAALRDHEQGASAAGVQVPSLKLLAFVAGAALAALGGGMLGMGVRAFDPSAYDPGRGLLWFAAVVVLGADSTLGALAAAALLVGLDAGARGGVAAALIGVLAVCVGRFTGGPYEALRVAAGRLRAQRRVRLTALGLGVRRKLRPAYVRAGSTEAAGPGVVRRAESDAGRASGARSPHGHAAGAGQRGGTGATTPAPEGVAHPAQPDTGSGHATEPGQRGQASATPGNHKHVARPARHDTGWKHAPAPGRTPTPPVLTAHTLHARYGGFTALDGVDLVVRAGQVTAVVGPNGAGKSTLFHCLAGTVRPARGQVRFGGRDITRLAAHARTRLGIARTFQQLAVFPSLTVAENVRVGAEQGRVAEPGAVERALRLFGLDGDVRSLPAADLPTGTLRRVELARAFAGGPRVLLLDEPSAGLDTAEVAALALVLRALAAEGTALLVVEHDLDLVAGLADVVHVMAAGRIVSSGPPGHVLDTPGTREAPA